MANKDDLRAGQGAAGSADGNASSGAAAAKASSSKAAPLSLPLAAKETFVAVVRTSASQRMGLEVGMLSVVCGIMHVCVVNRSLRVQASN